MREQDTGVLGEEYFEKDHFVARASGVEVDLDAYDNMVYACSKELPQNKITILTWIKIHVIPRIVNLNLEVDT